MIGRRRKRRRPIIHYSDMMNLPLHDSRNIRPHLDLTLGSGAVTLATPAPLTPTTPISHLSTSKSHDLLVRLYMYIYSVIVIVPLILAYPYKVSLIYDLLSCFPISSNSTGSHYNGASVWDSHALSHPRGNHPAITHHPTADTVCECAEPDHLLEL